MKRRRSRLPLPQRAARVLVRLKHVRGLTDAEKSVYALGLAATPEERWELVENCIRSLGYWKPLKRKLKSKEAIRRDKDLTHIVHIRNVLRCRRALKAKRGAIRKRTRL